MITLKEILMREEERFDLLNMSVCIGIVTAIVVLILGLSTINFATLGQQADVPSSPIGQPQD